MKIKGTSLIFIFVAFLICCISYSCKDDTECIGIVTVRQLSGDDNTGPVVVGSTVTIGEDTYSDDVKFQDITDRNGQVTNTWKNEAKLKIVATKDDYTGTAMLNLKAGETVEQTVWIK